MHWMFEECNALTSLDLSNFNTSNVTAMYQMFAHCYALASLDLSNFNTSNVMGMNGMFFSCKSLTVLDLSTFDTSNVTSMSSMFNNCESLTTIYGSNWDTSKSVHPYSNFSMFEGCNKLVGGKGTTYYWRNVDETYARIDRGEEAPGYFNDKNPAGIQPTTASKQKEGQVYNLSGQKLTSPQDGVKPTKGLYIQDGKKVIVK
jgi:surface protein